MHIDEKIQDDVAVLTISRDLTTGPDVSPLHDRIKSLTKDGITKVVVDFSKVRFCGSALLGALIAGLTTLRNAGGDLRLTGLAERMESLLAVTHLAGIFRTLNTVDLAVGSFKNA
ncbi:MAG: anti-sigma factor antagonist [Candidatus Latescibacteria bacterium]|nr:anti-sigma factor antagonist [Candidatus Latescibacterota bacterium]